MKLIIKTFFSDPVLSKHWRFNSVFWSLSNYLKFNNKNIPFFTLNISCQQSPAEADDSTIPIIFNEVLLYIDASYRHPTSITKRYAMIREEFMNITKRSTNFTAMCKNSSELFSFLDYYHEQAMKTIEIVKNFYDIVHKYRAIILHQESGNISDYFYAHTMHFCKEDSEGFVEVVSISIPVHSFIENIAIQDVKIKGKRKEYEIKPTANVNSMKGLMLLEYILFDIEKFMAENVQVRRELY